MYDAVKAGVTRRGNMDGKGGRKFEIGRWREDGFDKYLD